MRSGWPSPLPALHAGRRRRGRGGAPQGSARAGATRASCRLQAAGPRRRRRGGGGGGRGETKVSSSSRRRRRSCTSYKHTAPISPRMSVDFRMLAPGVLRSALGPLEASPAPPLARSACQEKGASVDP
ncbi:unnamed protein product [Prorocentrum cordatum]|uniref:Uncharacterized protein n=1 Tax=Prorocentrum cordatum TaxID=2364126 RepID=A0ABN9X9M3_9DINO|nr:unnamed protein product [Polarella glacialis]